MCFQPISVDVSKRQYFFNPRGFIPTEVNVPCGVCPSCLNSFRNSMFVRLYTEYNDCINSGGKVVFLTFTYSDDFVPCVSYSLTSDSFDYNFYRGNIRSDHDLFCFRKSDLQTFFNSFRKKFERLGFYSPFRYFVAGEYGTDYAHTQRPHYHALLFLSPDVVSFYDSFNSQGVSDFMFDVNFYWSYGIVSESKQYGLVVISSDCCSYVSKYVNKPLELLDLRRFSSFYDFLCSNLDNEYLVPDDFPYLVSSDSLFKYYMRIFQSRFFVLKSKGFGSSLLSDFNNLSPVDVVKKLQMGVSISSYSSGQSFNYNYPKYIVDRLLYDFNEDGLRILSYRGYHIKRLLMKDLIIQKSIDSSKIDISFVDQFCTEFGDPSLSRFASNLSDRSFLRKYFLYVHFMRGRIFNPDFLSRFKTLSFDNLPFDSLYGYLFDSCYGYHLCLDPSDFSSDVRSYDFYSSRVFSSPYYDHFLEFFHRFYFNYVNYLKKSLSLQRYFESKKLKELRDILSIYT